MTKLILTLLILSSFTTYGQEKNKQTKEDTIRNLEIGLDLLWLINKNQVPATSIFFRYNFVDKKQRHKAWRLRLGVDTNNLDSVGGGYSNVKIDRFSPYLRPGFEWQKSITKRVEYFYGSDISISYSYLENRSIINTPPTLNPTLSVVTDKNWIFGLHSFLGFKYRATNWLSISSETSINFTYRIRNWSAVSGIDLTLPVPNAGGKAVLDVKDFNIIFIPITVLNICITLNSKK